MSGERWTCDFCGCELDFDANSRRVKFRYIPRQYEPVQSSVADVWLTRREAFERAEAALSNQAETEAQSPRFGPLIIVALALLVACVMLGAVASALVISPSIARTRREIAEAYRPTATPAPTTTPITDTTAFISATATFTPGETAQPIPTVDPNLAVTVTATLPPPTVAPAIAATQPATALPPTVPPTLPPTFTPVPVATAFTPTIQAQTSVTPTLTIPPTQSPTPTTSPVPGSTIAATVTPTTASGSVITPTATTTVPVGAVVFQGSIRIETIKFQGTEANEADEYVELRNIGNQPVYLDGFSLKAFRTSDNQLIDQYVFTNGFIMAANQVCRIYTIKLSTADNCGTGTGFDSTVPIWPNTPGARASLYNQQNIEQARFTY
jgi:hypothetical protein